MLKPGSLILAQTWKKLIIYIYIYYREETKAQRDLPNVSERAPHLYLKPTDKCHVCVTNSEHLDQKSNFLVFVNSFKT